MLSLAKSALRAKSVGIVGLPNVGKSTLFNAICAAPKAEAANYPFTTIEPNVASVPAVDDHLRALARAFNTALVPPTLEVRDIAGLIEGASQGLGMGNQFLANVRGCDAILQVVRCFRNQQISTVLEGAEVDSVAEFEIIRKELRNSDVPVLEKLHAKYVKQARGSADAAKRLEVTERCLSEIRELDRDALVALGGRPHLLLEPAERAVAAALLSSKPFLAIMNLAPGESVADSAQARALAEHINAKYVFASADDKSVKAKSRSPPAGSSGSVQCFGLSSDGEFQLSQLSRETADDEEFYTEMAKEYGVTGTALSDLILRCGDLVGVQPFYTVGAKEARSWWCRRGAPAPEAASAIHTSFEEKFQSVDVYNLDKLIAAGSKLKAQGAGGMKQHKKAYIMQPLDVVEFNIALS